ncbi:MAG: hypothetical protein IPM34_11110 [Saprospiraceae bacterium]|nr:hypothetical protein [Saprospiraceae bacterium]
MQSYLKTIQEKWKQASLDGKFWIVAISTLIAAMLFIFNIGNYLEFIESREGCRLDDAILNMISPRDMSDYIFFVIYAGAVLVILYCLQSPWAVLFTAHLFLCMNLIRATCLYFTPLEPPHEIISLHDPLLITYVYLEHPKLKDLFFSGHTATLTLYCLVFRKQLKIQRILIFFTVLMAGLLLVQHCHYTIDVIGAVPMAWFAYQATSYLWKKLHLPLSKTLIA